jgi:hypothetical protein
MKTINLNSVICDINRFYCCSYHDRDDLLKFLKQINITELDYMFIYIRGELQYCNSYIRQKNDARNIVKIYGGFI